MYQVEEGSVSIASEVTSARKSILSLRKKVARLEELHDGGNVKADLQSMLEDLLRQCESEERKGHRSLAELQRRMGVVQGKIIESQMFADRISRQIDALINLAESSRNMTVSPVSDDVTFCSTEPAKIETVPTVFSSSGSYSGKNKPRRKKRPGLSNE